MMKQMGGLDFIVIDYVQLMGDSDVRGRNDTRAAALSVITSRLKALSKALNITVYALAQVSKTIDKRDNKRPILSDLSDSGSIANDADVVMFFYRDEYYLRKMHPPEKTDERLDYEDKLRAAAGVMEIIIGKQRAGPETTVKVKVDLGTDTMVNYYSDEDGPEFDFDMNKD